MKPSPPAIAPFDERLPWCRQRRSGTGCDAVEFVVRRPGHHALVGDDLRADRHDDLHARSAPSRGGRRSRTRTRTPNDGVPVVECRTERKLGVEPRLRARPVRRFAASRHGSRVARLPVDWTVDGADRLDSRRRPHVGSSARLPTATGCCRRDPGGPGRSGGLRADPRAIRREPFLRRRAVVVRLRRRSTRRRDHCLRDFER